LVDAKAPKESGDVGAAGVFRIFGKENEGWVLALVMALLGVSYEAVALAMSWRPKDAPGTPLEVTQDTTQVDEPEKTEEPKRIFTAEEYIQAATQGRADRRVSGRDKVMEILGISEREARRLYAECVAKGFIIPNPSTSPRAATIEH